ncbi:hypothetical protein [Neobacillus sp. SuZ13]|uniref:hypothetical protein n=1 Tax=Neobacillus sp. SuZ13 TaxID=3047875 RepID=UPI0024C09BB9|nr:hypothetical protein [Neobacillus sp. SuZ13]WHY67954.1 hypothetical protein QNH17_04685 [Neobacillus sp. SuZ13]
MTTRLRKGLERLRRFYLRKLLESGTTDFTHQELHSLTFSELERLYDKTFSSADSKKMTP